MVTSTRQISDDETFVYNRKFNITSTRELTDKEVDAAESMFEYLKEELPKCSFNAEEDKD